MKNIVRNLENGLLSGEDRSLETNDGCIRHELKLSGGKEPQLVCSIHAEMNAIAGAARKGLKDWRS